MDLADVLPGAVQADVVDGVGAVADIAAGIALRPQAQRPDLEGLAGPDVVDQGRPPVGDDAAVAVGGDAGPLAQAPGKPALQRQIGRGRQIDRVVPHDIGPAPRDDMAQPAVQQGRGRSRRCQGRGVVGKAPGRGGIPRVFQGRVVVEVDAEHRVPPQEGHFGGPAHVHIVDAEAPPHPVIGRLGKSPPSLGQASGIEGRHLVHGEVVIVPEVRGRRARRAGLGVGEGGHGHQGHGRLVALPVGALVAIELEVPAVGLQLGAEGAHMAGLAGLAGLLGKAGHRLGGPGDEEPHDQQAEEAGPAPDRHGPVADRDGADCSGRLGGRAGGPPCPGLVDMVVHVGPP